MSNTPALDAWRKSMKGKYPREEVKEDTSPKGTIYQRKRVRIPTPGSQRRCYNGCFHPSDWEIVWGNWEKLSSNVTESKLEFWNELGNSKNYEYKWERNEE